MMTSSNENSFPRYWTFVRGIHRWPVNSPHKGQWRGSLMLSLICARINGWVNNHEAGDLRCHRAHYGVTVMYVSWNKFNMTRVQILLYNEAINASINKASDKYVSILARDMLFFPHSEKYRENDATVSRLYSKLKSLTGVNLIKISDCCSSDYTLPLA